MLFIEKGREVTILTTERDITKPAEEVIEEPQPEPEVEPEVEPVPEPEPEPEKVDRRRKQPVDRGEAYWTVKEVATKLSCSAAWIYDMVRDGKISVIRQGRHIKINPEEVQRIMEKGLPLPPKENPPLEATEIVVDEETAQKLQPPPERKDTDDEEQEEEGGVGWPLNIFLGKKSKEAE